MQYQRISSDHHNRPMCACRTAIAAIVLCVFAGCSLTFLKTDTPLGVVPHHYTVSDPEFVRTFSNLLGPPVIPGNRVTSLQNGDEIFPSMLAAIREAKKSINFETYIFWDGEIGRQFSDALIEKSLSGVKVHVVLDWYGADKISPGAISDMEQAGVEVARYHPLKWYDLPSVDRRTHRKLLIVDGRVGFTGGVGIADDWLGSADSPEHWRDSHFKVEGPVVAQLQAAFMDNWLKSKATVLDGDDYFPELAPAGSSMAQVFRSSPEEGSSSVQLMYLLSIAAASKEILMSVPYFVPDKTSRDALIDAARRGVRIEIIVPGKHIDEALVRSASRRHWGELLEAGIRIYEYLPTMYHCKAVIVDGLFTSIGSTNLDNRSFKLNEEANLNVLDRAFAQQQRQVFEADKQKSREVTHEGWARRPLLEKFTEQVLRLVEKEL